MPEPFKNLFNLQLIHKIGDHVTAQWRHFDHSGFIAQASSDLDALELKARSAQITQSLIDFLPADFEHAADIMLNSLGKELEDDLSAGSSDTTGLSGWAIMPMADVVALQGQDHFDLSMLLLKEMTKRSSSEFAIRPFILRNPAQTIAVMKQWATDKNHHVRRLASEGCRPRLPWGMQLPVFIEEPAPVIELLTLLKDDSKEYVRRSVANNLNDIAKDHPDLVAKLTSDWLRDASTQRKRMLKHACRTLLKQGHKKTLSSFGFSKPKLSDVSLKLSAKKVVFGDALFFDVCFKSLSTAKQNLMIDYVVHHQKANGSLSGKVFKWTTVTLASNEVKQLNKKHPMRAVTTRVYYPGLHRLEVLVNGEAVASADFQLIMK